MAGEKQARNQGGGRWGTAPREMLVPLADQKPKIKKIY